MPARKKGFRHHVSRHARTVLRHVKNHCIPHEGNNHHPHLLRHGALLVYSFLLIALKVAVVVAPIALPSISVFSSAITVHNIFELTNAARTTIGLPSLSLNDRLIQAAQAKADDMMKNQYFAHQSPDGRWPWNFIRATGYDYTYAGENLAVHFLQAEDTQAAWLASPTHRANIVNTHYTETGIGISSGMYEGAESIFVVQMFGTPIPDAVAPVAVGSSKTNSPTSPPAHQPTNLQAPSSPAPTVESFATTNPIKTTTIKPAQNGVDVTVTTEKAKSVTAQLGTASTPLKPTDGQPNVWTGTVPVDPRVSSPGGDALIVSTQDARGKTQTQSVALVAPGAKTQDVYAFNGTQQKEMKLFGIFTVSNLQDTARRTYVFFIVFLAALLLINVFVKIRIQHPSVIVHTLAVIGLAGVLLLL